MFLKEAVTGQIKVKKNAKKYLPQILSSSLET